MSVAANVAVAYCGLPPDPAVIWTTWRIDPALVVVLLALLALALAPAFRRHEKFTRRHALLLGGWSIGTLALISPLCPLSVSLFAARATQHVLLTMVAAPLLAAGVQPRRAPARPVASALAFAAALWFWHMPLPYAATFASVAVYWCMHATLLASAVWLWWNLLHAGTRLAGVLLASLASALQTGLLGALITLAPRAFYAPHFLTTDAWGLTPLQDQQLGGAIMWIVGGSVFFAATMIALARRLAAGPAATPRVALASLRSA